MQTTVLNPHIVPLSTAHCKELMEISVATFTATYAEVNTAENMRDYIETNFSEAATLQQLSQAGTEFFMVKLVDKTAGYLKLNSGGAQTELKNANALEIERIYVLKEFQGNGLGKLLIEKAMAVGKKKQADYLWLGVWEHNLAALAFYRRMGFVEFDRHIFMLGNDEQKDIMMKFSLNATLS